MTSTLAEKAVVGRRVMFTYYRDLKRPDLPEYPGIITDLVPNQGASLKIRLDGKRSTLHAPPDYQGLRYLDEVITPVPALPMGRFHPTADDFGGDWEGVPVCQLGDDDIVILTADRDAARAALAAFCKDMYLDLEFLPLDRLEARWAVFEWEPEDAEYPWTVRWDAAQAHDQAIRIYYLPA
jgi:hypothetical protein